MSTQDAAIVQVLLEGVPLPAERKQLIEYARSQDGGAAIAQLARIPDREYRTLDEVGEALAEVQPSWPEQQADVPKPESGNPPGGDAYTQAAARGTGAVRAD